MISPYLHTELFPGAKISRKHAKETESRSLWSEEVTTLLFSTNLKTFLGVSVSCFRIINISEQ